MGILSKIFNDGKDLAKIANAVANIKNILDDIDMKGYTDNENWFVTAWVCRVGIIDVIEKNEWPMTYRLFVPINGHQTRMTLHEAYLMSVGRLAFKSGELEVNIKDAILDILEKGEWFYKIDKQIPDSKKAIYK